MCGTQPGPRLTRTRATDVAFIRPVPAALLCAGGRLPHLVFLTASHRYPLLPQQVEGFCLRSLLGGGNPSPGFYLFQTSSHLRQTPCPKNEAQRPSLGPGGPALCPTHASHALCVPTVWGTRGGLVSLAAQRLFLNHYSGISVLQGGEVVAACPAKDLAVDKTWEVGGHL